MPVPQSVSFERFDSRLTIGETHSTGSFLSPGHRQGSEAPSELLLRPIPTSPNKGKATLSQGEYSGYPLVATAAGQRVVIFRRDAKLSPVQITKEFPGPVLAVAWRKYQGVATSGDSKRTSATPNRNALQGALAAACETEAIVFLPFKPSRSSASFSVNFPFQWSRAYRIPNGASEVAWSMSSGALAACSGNNVHLWQIPSIAPPNSPCSDIEIPAWSFALPEPDAIPPLSRPLSPSPPTPCSATSSGAITKATCVAISPDSVVVACAFGDVPQLHFRAVDPPKIDTRLSPDEQQTEDELAEEDVAAFCKHLPPSMVGGPKQSQSFGPTSPSSAKQFSASFGVRSPPVTPADKRDSLGASFSGTMSSMKVDLAAKEFHGGAVLELGGSVLSVKFAKAHHFKKLPGSNVVFALESNGNVKVILCCSTVTERKFICRATVCAVVKLPPGPEYTVTWGLLPEESGESLAKTPMGLGAGNMNVSFRLKKAATGPQAKAQSGGDQWWAGLAHHSHGKSSKKSVQVAPQTTEMPDTDWLMCVGSDRTMLVYKIEMALRQGDVMLDQKSASFVFRVELDPCGDKTWDEVVMCTSANVSNIAGGLEAPARLEGVSNDVQPGVVSLVTSACSMDGSRRWMSAWDVHLPTRKATRSAHYASHTDPVIGVAGHATQPFVASCSATGEAILWLCEFSYAAAAALSHFAILQGTFGNLAWSPALATSEGVWQTGLLWGFALDGSCVQAFCVRPYMWEDQGTVLPADHTLSMGVQEENDAEASGQASPSVGHASGEPRHLRVVLESSKEETGEFDKQLIIAVIGASMHVWRVVVCPDDMGCPSVFQSRRLPTYQLPRRALAIATLDPLDHSWRGGKQSNIVVTGGERGMMDVCEIRDAVVYHDTFEVDVEGAVKISDMTFMTAWELMVLVVDGSGQTRGLILETVSRNNWRMEGMLPRTFSSGAKLSSFLAGDGSALVGVFDRGQVTIFGPVPWSWKQTGVAVPSNLTRKFTKRWGVIRDVNLEQGGCAASEASALPASCMTWCTDGSIVVGSGTRMAVLGAGIYDASSMSAEVLAEGRNAWAPGRGPRHGLSALWTKIDSLRAGASVVYYHPTNIEHAILAGQIGTAANNLVSLYRAMRRPHEPGSPVGVECGYEGPLWSMRQPVTPKAAASNSESSAPNTPSLGPIEPWKPKSLTEQLTGVDLAGVRKIAMMKVPDETKAKAVAKLVEREEKLALVLCEDGAATWDAEAKQLIGVPVWANVLATLATVEKEREAPELTWSGGDQNETQDNSAGGGAQDSHSEMYDDDQVLTEEEAKGLQALLEECREQMSGEGDHGPGVCSPANGHHRHNEHEDSLDAGVTLTGLSLDAVVMLLAYAVAFVELRSGAGASLDLCGKMVFLVTRARMEYGRLNEIHHPVSAVRGSNGNGVASPVGIKQGADACDLSAMVDSTVLCLAKHSDQQEALIDQLSAAGQAQSLLSLHPALWLDKDEKLKELVEKCATDQFRKRQNPMDAALMYVLAGRVRVLSNLFRARDEKAVGDFLLRDFSMDQNRKAACKNAFSLIGKHQPEAAIAFFILGNNMREVVSLITQNLRRPLLAVLVVRLVQGHEEAKKLVREVIIPTATEQQDRGLLHLCYWYVDEFAASYSVLWSHALAKDSVGKKVETKGKLGGLLSRFDDDDADDDDDEPVELFLEDNIHPCTLCLVSIVNERPKMKMASRLMSMPKAPRKMLREMAAHGLLSDGCAVLAEEILQGEGVLDGDCSRLQPLTVCVCLARLAELIRAEGAKHASTGENQVDLSRLKEELHKLVALLQLELRHVRPLLVRFCLTRGFWRLAHALVTGYFGGAIDQRDGSLAAVAVHPLTSSMADSIAEIAFQLDHLTVLPRAVLSRIERKGKFLQLILHSLTVDNTGNAGALSVLAACVMTTHFILIWSRKDFESLVQLMNQNEGLADRDNAAALSWLMQACNPTQFSIGRHRRNQAGSPRAGAGSEFDSIGESITRYSSGASHLGLGDAEEEESEARLVGELIEEQADGCLMWVLVARFRERLRLALSGPIATDLGGSFRARTTSWDWSLEGEPEGSDRRSEPVAPSTDEAASHGSSGQSSPPTSPGGAARHYFKGFAKGAKAAAEKFMEKVDLSLPSRMSPASPNRKPATPSDKEKAVPLPQTPIPSSGPPVREHQQSLLGSRAGSAAGISTNFFTDEGFAGAESWQKIAPEQLGKRLMSALRGWRHRMKDSLMLDIYAFILNAGDLVEVSWCEEAARRQFFDSKEHKKALWDFYSCQDYFRPLVDDAIKAQDGSTSTSQVRTLQEGVEHYTRRNALLRAMRYHKTFRGTLNVQLLRGHNLKVKDNFFNMLGGKDSRPTTYAILQYDGSVDPQLYGSLVPKHMSEPVKKDTSPHYNQIFTFDVVSARHNLKIQLMQKQTIGDDEPIGSADLDISRIQENQVASLDVPVERDGETVGELKLRMIFKYEPKSVEDSLRPIAREKPDQHGRSPPFSAKAAHADGTTSPARQSSPSRPNRRSSLTSVFFPSST